MHIYLLKVRYTISYKQAEAKGCSGGGGGTGEGDREGGEESEGRQWAPVGGQSYQSDLVT